MGAACFLIIQVQSTASFCHSTSSKCPFNEKPKIHRFGGGVFVQNNAVGTPAHKANEAIGEAGVRPAFELSLILQQQSTFINKSLFIILMPVWYHRVLRTKPPRGKPARR
jgi:hypothetical protein